MRYLSECPHCHTVYHLDLMQMNIAQGNVRCVSCEQRFDAYRCFVHDPHYIENQTQNYLTEIILPHATTVKEREVEHAMQNNSLHSFYVHDVMQQRIDGSRLNLYTYLNYLDLVSPIHSTSKLGTTYSDPNQPRESLSHNNISVSSKIRKVKKNRTSYYFAWGVINIALLGLLIFQILYF